MNLGSKDNFKSIVNVNFNSTSTIQIVESSKVTRELSSVSKSSSKFVFSCAI